MSGNEHPQKPKPGLSEALHPEIGNGALWTDDLHESQLRSPDPTRKLDSLLFDEKERDAIIKKWKSLSVPESPESNSELSIESSLEPPPAKEPKVTVPSPQRDPVPDWLVTGDHLLLEEDPNKAQYLEEAPPVMETANEGDEEILPLREADVEGKRVKKAIKKAKKAAKKKVSDKSKASTDSPDPVLSPYTSWLKSLRGSEYVHPYEDDFGIGQLSSTTREGISETFADLLAAQGYKDEAVRMYEQLMEKYPEKSSFFAAKIEALK